jgi:K+/H+ antiporter YhaU regulatory subunit KhtT
MKKSGMNLEKYKTALLQAGPAGKQAFTQLATAIASADTRVIRINESLAKMGHKLLETARWRASNAAIMAVTSSISEAYRFAQDLDKSLTDIRIVTGLSAEYMEDFAKQAQKAAKALSTTTNEYAKASLIYFQQGLSEAEVQERTELTIRMANVTG